MGRRVLPIIAAGGPAVRFERPDGEAPNAPLALLRACHRRIRLFTEMAGRIAAATADDAAVAEAAAAVERYFFVALPKHVADEEESLAPRLGRTPCAAALSEMAGQHRRIEEALDTLRPHWQALGRRQGAPDRGLAGLTARMAALWEPHLALEEREIFPLVETMEQEPRDAVWREMRARRARVGGATAA